MQLSPGCLYHPNDDSCAQTYDHMINKSEKEVMFDLYNKLSKLDVQKSPGPKVLLKVTSQSLEKIISACKGKFQINEGFSSVDLVLNQLLLIHLIDSLIFPIVLYLYICLLNFYVGIGTDLECLTTSGDSFAMMMINHFIMTIR